MNQINLSYRNEELNTLLDKFEDMWAYQIDQEKDEI